MRGRLVVALSALLVLGPFVAAPAPAATLSEKYPAFLADSSLPDLSEPIVCLAPTGPRLQDDGGAGRDAHRTAPLPLSGGVIRGCMDPNDSEDWWALDMVVGEPLRVFLTPPPCWDFDLLLLDPALKVVGSSLRGDCKPDQLEAAAALTGTYHLVVLAFTGAGDYNLTVEKGPGVPRVCVVADDGRSGRDATPAAALPLPDGDTPGCLDKFDVSDVYDFDVPVVGGFRLKARSPECAYFIARIFDDDVEAVRTSTFYSCRTAPPEARTEATWWAYEPAAFRVVLAPSAFGTPAQGNYTLTLNRTVAPPPCEPQDDGGSGRDASTRRPAALPDGVSGGCLDAYDNRDVLQFAATAGETLTLRLSPQDCSNADLTILDPAGSYAAGSYGGACADDTAAWTAASAGTYTALVTRGTPSGRYVLELTRGVAP